MRLFILLCCMSFCVSAVQANPGPRDSITVFIFMHDACVITQNYSLLLHQLHEEYSSDQLKFVGLFPDFSSKPENIEAFRKKYRIPFELKTDYFKTWTKKLGATVTPEVVVYRHSDDTILYKGRIDNMYARVGKKRTITTTSELKDALEAIRNGQPIAITETEAVGCLINFSRGPAKSVSETNK